MPKETIELREGLPGFWRHNPPEGPHWYGVQHVYHEGDYYIVREMRAGSVSPVQEDVVSTLSAAEGWIRDRLRAKGRA